MIDSSFESYAASPDLSEDATYTVELLIEKVRNRFDEKYWDDWSERIDAREAMGYQPAFSQSHVESASNELKNLKWASFQRLRDSARPVRDISAIRYLPSLTGLVLQNNDIADIGPLSNCTRLRRLHLSQNPIRDLSPLESLPELGWLEISIDQLPEFKRLSCLPALRKLRLGLDGFDSFVGFPSMPQLRVIQGAHVKSLNGIDQFSRLENVVNFSGEFGSLEPLRELRHLTHANILNSNIQSLEHLVKLTDLRDLTVNTSAYTLDLSPLNALPLLHCVSIKCQGEVPDSLALLRAQMTSWDNEFLSETPRYTPSLELQVVDQETFNYYDTETPFGIDRSNCNEGLLGSELDWLDEKFDAAFSKDFVEGDDYEIPSNWGGARSRTIVVYSERAFSAFPRLVLAIQRVLAHSKHDWIIYFQSDRADADAANFIVWVYPQRILVTEEYVYVVRGLMDNGKMN